MHKRISFHGHAESVGALLRELQPIAGVITVTHVVGGSAKPPGDVLELEVLNRDADEVLRRAEPYMQRERGHLVINIAESNALVDHDKQKLINADADELLWEELESDLRNRGRITVNYLVLMALAGVIAAMGLLFDPVLQTMAFVGASIIAPGFEPLAKLAQGMALREGGVCVRALLSSVVGYSVLFGAAFVSFWTLSARDGAAHASLFNGALVGALTGVRVTALVVSASAAIAGILMVVSLRDLYVVGPLITLVLIVAVALAGSGFASHEVAIGWRALRRAGLDMVLVVALGTLVFVWKQRTFHRRRPIT